MRDDSAPRRRLRVLFLCTGNSCRSQMAEGWARALRPREIEALSAGTHPLGLDPLAVQAMAEVGVDISGQVSTGLGEIGGPVDVVVTVCGAARETCPVVPGARLVHAGFDDPPQLARHATSDDEALVHYRRVRDEIRAFVETLPGSVCADSGASLAPRPPAFPSAHDKDPSTMTTSKSDACCSSDCCGGARPSASSSPPPDADTVRESVREGYAKIARTGAWSPALSPTLSPTTTTSASAPAAGCCGGGGRTAGGGCCGPVTFSPEQLAAAIGYSAAELEATPAEANLGLSCGNPTALAALKPGEVVLDLGSGSGFDCFIAGRKVGPTGRVIGVDMTPDMVGRARRALATYAAQTGLGNVEFRLGEIEHLPVPDASVDVVISNCVLNLSPDKPQVWREIARVLKPGGRVAVSDLALLRPLPESVKADVEALVGCVAGAVLVDETRQHVRAAGLVDVELRSKSEYIEAMTAWEDPLYRRIVEALPAGAKPSEFITSLEVVAKRAQRHHCAAIIAG